MKFSGKMWLNIKSHKKTRLHSVCRKCKFGKSYKYCQNLKWKNTFRYFRVFDFGYRTKSKTRKSQKTIFFSKSISWPLSFCLSSFLSFPNLKLQLLSKFEVKEHFPRFRVFDFGYRIKSKTRKSRKFYILLLKAYLDLYVFVSVHFCRFWILNYSYCQNLK